MKDAAHFAICIFKKTWINKSALSHYGPEADSKDKADYKHLGNISAVGPPYGFFNNPWITDPMFFLLS